MTSLHSVTPAVAIAFLAIATVDVTCSIALGALPVPPSVQNFLLIVGIGLLIIWRLEKNGRPKNKIEISEEQVEADLDMIVELMKR